MRTLNRRTFTASGKLALLLMGGLTLVFTLATPAWWIIALVEGIDWLRYVGLLFAVFAGFLYLALIWMVAAWLRYGESSLQISAYPAEADGALVGTLTTGAYLARQDEIRLKLVELEVSRVRRGDTSKIWEEVLWKQELLIDPRGAEVFQGKCTIPFRFEGVPAEPRADDLKGAVVWQIQAQGKGRRPKYLALFTLNESGSPGIRVSIR